MKNNLSSSVAIIIPSYNAERTIIKAIQSCLQQTYPVKEIIVIDDGSTDNTKTVIQTFSKDIYPIQYYYKENGGLSSARNAGLEKVNADYVCFLDADDYLENTALDSLLRLIESENTQIAMPSLYYEHKNQKVKLRKLFEYPQKTINAKKYMLEIMGISGRGWRCTSVLYKTAVIKEHVIKFENNRYSEDAFFNIEYLSHIDKIALLNSPTLNVIRSSQTLTNSFQPTLTKDYIDLKERFEKWVFSKKENVSPISQLAVSNLSLRNLLLIWENLNHRNAPFLVKEKISLFEEVISKFGISLLKKSNPKKLYSEKKFYSIYLTIFKRLVIKKRYYILFLLMYLRRI